MIISQLNCWFNPKPKHNLAQQLLIPNSCSKSNQRLNCRKKGECVFYGLTEDI